MTLPSAESDSLASHQANGRFIVVIRPTESPKWRLPPSTVLYDPLDDWSAQIGESGNFPSASQP
jgi:hypothetical protein